MSGHRFCFQAEDGIRDLVRSRGLGDVYKRQGVDTDLVGVRIDVGDPGRALADRRRVRVGQVVGDLSLIHI